MGKPTFTGQAHSAPKRRGRPRKNPLPGDITGTPQVTLADATDKRTDKQVLQEVTERFETLRDFAAALAQKQMRSLIISGAPGIGKTYTLDSIISHYQAKGKVKFTIVKGFMTAAMLYRLLFEHQDEDEVIFLDDCDAIFWNEDACNLLKAALDTVEHRIVSYRAMGDDDIPTSFEFRGAMVFASNIDFHHYIDVAKNKIVEHLKALLSRSQYLSMRLHTKRAVSLWVTHMLREKKMLLGHPHGMTMEQSEDILGYLLENSDRIHPLMSLRTAVKCVELVRINESKWRRYADFTLLKQSH